jgi:hypothetical protein
MLTPRNLHSSASSLGRIIHEGMQEVLIEYHAQMALHGNLRAFRLSAGGVRDAAFAGAEEGV